MSTHLADPVLVARVLRELRRRVRPVTGDRLASVLNVSPVRRVQEAIWAARCRGKRIVSGPDGYRITRSAADVAAFVAREERRMSRERRALRGVKRGHVPQARLVRERRAS